MNFPRRRFLGSSLVLLGSTLLDALTTPLSRWNRSLTVRVGADASSALAEGDPPSSSGAADPSFTELSKSPTCRSYLGIIPLRTAPRARGPREINTCSKMAGAAATTCGCLESRSISAGQSLIPSSATRCRLMCEVDPSSRCCKSWRKPLLMASATTSEATPAATPMMDIPVMIPMNACRLLARR